MAGSAPEATLTNVMADRDAAVAERDEAVRKARIADDQCSSYYEEMMNMDAEQKSAEAERDSLAAAGQELRNNYALAIIAQGLKPEDQKSVSEWDAALACQPAAEPVNAHLLDSLSIAKRALELTIEDITAAEQAPAPSVNGELVEALRYARRMLRMTTHPHHDAYDAEYLDKLIAKYAPEDGS